MPARPDDQRPLHFTRADVERFAAASGDRNPLHVDPAFARRSAFGGCVVHGALVSLGLLGALPPDQLERVSSLRASFSSAVLPDTELAVALRAGSRGRWEIGLTGRGKLLARLIAGTKGDPAAGVDPGTLGGPASGAAMRGEAATLAAVDLEPGRAVVGAYHVGAGLAALAADLGAAPLRTALREGLAWASYVVGMELPGRDALFTGITLADGGAVGPAAAHSIRLREHDARTGQLAIDGALLDDAGAVRALARIECFLLSPAATSDAGAVAAAAPPPTDRGEVVVVGGSRGFGAALALSLLAAGYGVHVVYAASADSAAQLSAAAGPLAPRLTLHRLDARNAAALASLAAALRGRGAPLAGLVLNAAPPPLAMGVTGESAGELSRYVAESVALAAGPLGSLAPLLDGKHGWVVVTSSPAITAPPRDWPHYTAAKGALEGLARWLAASAPALRTVILRPPKMATDLTNTPSGRLGAAAPGAIAGWTVAQLAGGELATGLTVLEPDARAAGAARAGAT